nr:uncharacterized protein LOC120965394 [Aegilops tauschii subsp. strangulata]
MRPLTLATTTTTGRCAATTRKRAIASPSAPTAAPPPSSEHGARTTAAVCSPWTQHACPRRCTSSSLTFTNHAVPSGLLPPAQAEAAATGGDRKKICCHDEDESFCCSGCLEQHGSGDAARTSCARDCCCVFTWSATCPRRCKSSNLLTNKVIVDGSEETKAGAGGIASIAA